jgi:hypothetical protein
MTFRHEIFRENVGGLKMSGNRVAHEIDEKKNPTHLLKVGDALRGREDDANALRPGGLAVNNFLSGAHGPAAGL